MKRKVTALVSPTWKILTEDTNHIIFRSAARSAHTTTPNLCHELPSGEINPPNSNPIPTETSPDFPEQNFLWSQSECEDNSSLSSTPTPMATFTVYDLDRIPSTTPGAEPPRDARDSGSARSHSTHLETSSSDRA